MVLQTVRSRSAEALSDCDFGACSFEIASAMERTNGAKRAMNEKRTICAERAICGERTMHQERVRMSERTKRIERRDILGKPDEGYGLMLLTEKIERPDLYSRTAHVGIFNLFGKTILIDAWTRMRGGRQVLLMKLRESSAQSRYRRVEDRPRKRKPPQDY